MKEKEVFNGKRISLYDYKDEQGNDIVRVTTNQRKKRLEKKAAREAKREERKDKRSKSKGKKVKSTRRIRAQF